MTRSAGVLTSPTAYGLERLAGLDQAVLDAMPIGVCVVAADGGLSRYNAAAAAIWRESPQPGAPARRYCGTLLKSEPDDLAETGEALLSRVLETDDPCHHAETMIAREDGGRSICRADMAPLHDDAGLVAGAVLCFQDITAEREAQAHLLAREHAHRELLQALPAAGRITMFDDAAAELAEQCQKRLIDELNHRVKNTLATVQSIAAHTLRLSENPEQFREAFEARLMALSRAHDLLNRSSWEGAGLSDVVAQALAPHLDRQGRTGPCESPVSLQGENLPMTPRAALSMAMVVHELAANAARHGALSAPGGRLNVDWRTADRTNPLVLTWQETGGPAPATQRRRGFGSRLIERSLRHELGGRASFEFAPAGLTCVLNLSRKAVAAPRLQASHA